MAKKRVYFFGGGRAEGGIAMKDVLGGKGAALADMTNLGLPVPPGFTIAAEVCRLFLAGGGKVPADVNREISANLAKLERTTGRRFGDPKNPLLLSVRSGAQFSMPGMMDTILDLGMNDRIAAGLAAKSGDPRFAYDCYRRFLSMFGTIVLGVPGELFGQLLEEKRQERSAPSDAALDAEDLSDLCRKFKLLVKERTRKEYPQLPQVQLSMARDAVFRSWDNDRAKYYRKAQGIPDDIGTAVTVQAMVFGNAGSDSATGVWFTRNPSTGAKEFYGEYLVNAQGADVVAGARTTRARCAT
jgi:pyruvate,orthophosphate dikinase